MGFFNKKYAKLSLDLHSHLIPNVDDGSQSLGQSINMLKRLMDLGFKKVITTPHIHPSYPNTPEIILSGLSKLQDEIGRLNLEIEVEAAAEYFVDESFQKKVKEGGLILSFGGKHVLVESSFLNKPVFFESVMFDMQSAGYTPVLAHPERYQFLEGSLDWLIELKSMGVLFQVTFGSLGGYYGATPEKIAKALLKNKMVDFLGSDLHRESHLNFLEKGLKSKVVQNAIKEGALKNHELL
ncbi:tyrosine-protein phosphatase [Ekhidna sp.]